MRVGVALVWVGLAACGRSGFDAADAEGPDFVPDPIDWADFPTLSAASTFTGINRPVEIDVMASFGTGTPTIELSQQDGLWNYVIPTSPVRVTVEPASTLQFRVLGNTDDTAFITVTNHTAGGTLIDTTRGVVASLVTGDGSTTTPFTVPAPLPTSCGAFLAAYPEQDGRDGIHTVTRGAVDCDMTTDAGGWTLVARVTAASTTHTTAGAIGTLVERTQATLAKLADTEIDAIGFTQARFSIDTVGKVYVNTATLDLSGLVNFSIVNTAAPAITGPFSYAFRTSNGCSSDCGAAVVADNMGFGPWCGYRYYSSAGNKRPGMGCQGNFGKNGTVWVR